MLSQILGHLRFRNPGTMRTECSVSTWVDGTWIPKNVYLPRSRSHLFRFVTEPFIVPGLYEQYTNGTAGPSVDEFTLSQNMGDRVAEIMEEHYQTFITEEDFMLMADAGLNWIRLPIGFWALETFGNEPFLEGVCWKYIVQALQWARKYGLRVKLDLHASPGSANGWNHSGRIGQLNFLRGAMGLANAQRTLDYIRRLAEFIHQPEWRDVVPIL